MRCDVLYRKKTSSEKSRFRLGVVCLFSEKYIAYLHPNGFIFTVL